MGHLKKFNEIKHFHCPHNIKTRVISDITTAIKTFRAERRFVIRYRVLGRRIGKQWREKFFALMIVVVVVVVGGGWRSPLIRPLRAEA